MSRAAASPTAGELGVEPVDLLPRRQTLLRAGQTDGWPWGREGPEPADNPRAGGGTPAVP